MGPRLLAQGKNFYACRALAGRSCGCGPYGRSPGPAGRLPWRARRSVQAGRPGERLSPASGPLRSTRPEETRRQMRRPPLRPAQARMTSQKQPGPRRPETAATSPPDLHRPGMAATRPGSTRPRLLAAQAHHRGPRRLPRRGSLADRAARRSAGCHPYPCKKTPPSIWLSRPHTGVCAAACRVRLFASMPCGGCMRPPAA